MAIINKTLQVIDTLKVLVVDKTTKKTMFTGLTTKAGLSNKNDKVDIFSGIGGKKQASFKTKKETMLDAMITEFNLDFFASLNGVALDTTSTGTIYFLKPITITTLAATVTDATRIIAVQKLDGTFLDIVSGAPSALNEVKVTGDELTFYTGYTDTAVNVTYEAPAGSGKDNMTVVFNSESFPKNAEVILSGVVYENDTQNIVADINVDLYSCAIDGDWDLSFEVSKNVEIPFKAEILIPKFLPDGTLNSSGDTGKMYVTEI